MTAQATERIVDALRREGKHVVDRDGTIAAQCPAHDDDHASLSIGPRRDGKGAVIHCHAGCDYRDVLGKLSLSPRDLFDDPALRAVYNGHATYDYPDGRRVHRAPGKKFYQNGNTKGRALFHADRIGDAETVYVAEGEKDVLAIEAAGGVAVCPPQGAGQKNLDRYDWSPLRGKDVVLLADQDAPGRKHAAQVAELLHGIASSVQIKEAAVGKDAADHIAAGKTLDELVPYTPPRNSATPQHPSLDEVQGLARLRYIDGAELLNELLATIKRYVVFPDEHAAVAVALWIAATHALPAFECAPRLVITSPEKRCGKTRLLDIICGTCHEPLATVDATVAAIFRSLGGKHPPTLVIDEADGIFGTKKAAENNEDLRKLLNAGHQSGKPAIRCVGPLQIPTEFDVFAMAALAGIGTMPDTITDRAVNIKLRRRGTGEKVSQFRSRRDKPTLEKLRGQLAEWTAQRVDELSKPVPIMPVEDRAADTWEPMIAIADAAGDHWPTLARTACTVLVAAAVEADEDDSLAVKLLADIQAVFGALPGVSFLPSSELAASLNRLDESPWRDFELTTRKLAYRLKGFGVKPGHNTAKTARGYHRATFRDAFDRYLSVHPSDPSDPSATGSDQQQSWDGSEPPDGSIRPDKNIRPDETAGQTPFTDGWTDRTDTPAGTGHRPQCTCGRPAPVDRATGLCQWCTIKDAAKQAEGGPVVDSVCIIDADRSACLCAEGLPAVVAAVLIAADGRTDLVLVAQELIDDTRHTYNHTTPQAPHEQLGALPLEFVRRLTVSARAHRCGRPNV